MYNFTEGSKDQPGLLIMIIISFLLHAIIISFAIASTSILRGKADLATPYMVRLISPSDLGPKSSHFSEGEKKEIPKKPITSRPEKTLTISREKVEIDRRGPIVLPKMEASPAEKRDWNAEMERLKKRIEDMREEVEKKGEMEPHFQSPTIQQRKQSVERPKPSNSQDERESSKASIWRVQTAIIAEYITVVKERVRQNWSFPRTNETLSAVISLQVDRDGRIEDIRFERRSGSLQFDESIMRAIKKTVLPPPPEGMMGEVFVITFHSIEAGART